MSAEPASVVVLRRLAAEARARRALPATGAGSAARSAPVEGHRHPYEHDAQEQLRDPHDGLVAGEPGHRRHQQDDGDTGHEDGEEPLAAVSG